MFFVATRLVFLTLKNRTENNTTHALHFNICYCCFLDRVLTWISQSAVRIGWAVPGASLRRSWMLPRGLRRSRSSSWSVVGRPCRSWLTPSRPFCLITTGSSAMSSTCWEPWQRYSSHLTVGGDLKLQHKLGGTLDPNGDRRHLAWQQSPTRGRCRAYWGTMKVLVSAI